MLSRKIISSFIMVLVIFCGLCGCNSEFDRVRENTETNKIIKQESTPKISDFEVVNVGIDYVGSSSYSRYLDVVGTIKNNSNKKASSITLTVYLYKNDNIVLTEKDYVFDLGAYDENTFEISVDKIKLLTCDEYIVKITDVF